MVNCSRICHFGRNPRKGGSPAKDKNKVDTAILWGVGREICDEIFGVSRLNQGANVKIMEEEVRM